MKDRMAPNQRGRAAWMRTKQMAHMALRHSEPLRPWLLHKMGTLDISLVVRAEQAPNPQSRIILSKGTDALGIPKAVLDWRTSAIDVDSVAGLVNVLDAEFQRLGFGSIEAEPWLSDPSRTWRTDPLISAHPISGFHHMGTMRMSSDPGKGVTDSFGRVHGIAISTSPAVRFSQPRVGPNRSLDLKLNDRSSITLHSENSNFESGHFGYSDGSIVVA